MGSCFKMVRSQATPQATANPIIINLPPIDPNHIMKRKKSKNLFLKGVFYKIFVAV